MRNKIEIRQKFEKFDAKVLRQFLRGFAAGANFVRRRLRKRPGLYIKRVFQQKVCAEVPAMPERQTVQVKRFSKKVSMRVQPNVFEMRFLAGLLSGV